MGVPQPIAVARLRGKIFKIALCVKSIVIVTIHAKNEGSTMLGLGCRWRWLDLGWVSIFNLRTSVDEGAMTQGDFATQTNYKREDSYDDWFGLSCLLTFFRF